MTFDLVVTSVLSVFLVLVTIDRQHDANRVLYVKAVWPRPVLGSGVDLYYFHETRFACFLKIQHRKKLNGTYQLGHSKISLETTCQKKLKLWVGSLMKHA